ncbi:hypothetical protein BGZ94_004105, partial [Podila epigama]
MSMTTTSSWSVYTKGFLYTLAVALTVTSVVHGQVSVVSNAASVRYGTKLYIFGGGITREIPKKEGHMSGPETIMGEGQTAVLDLSQPWPAVTPPLKRLKNGPRQYNFPAAVNANGTKIATFHSGTDANSAF